MRPERWGALLAAGLAVSGVALLAVQYAPATLALDGETHESATVQLVDENGTALGTVDAAVADTRSERFTGLSETSCLPYGEGMLFVYRTDGTHSYVMRNMSFPLDIVFVASNGTITSIHHAPVEPGESGEALTRYTGYGKWVLEVPRGWTTVHNVSVGDDVEIKYDEPLSASRTFLAGGTLKPG